MFGVNLGSIFGGVRIVEDQNLVIEDGEDWSGVRSPGRAKRRRARGFRQNITTKYKPRPEALSMDDGHTLIMHPAMADQLRKEARRG
jgi:hypothetical protein